jgi:long-chain acyl-CoA synthetase
MLKEYLLKELSRYNIGTYADIIYRHALLSPEKEAYVYGPKRITHLEFNARVNSLIHALHKMKVKKGDVVGILSQNCLEYADFYGAAMKGGFIAAPFNSRLQASELEYIVNYSEANTILVGSEFLDVIHELKPRIKGVKNFVSLEKAERGMIPYEELLSYSKEEPDVQAFEDDPITIIFTSGTTGTPRGALYTQSKLFDDSRTLIINVGLHNDDKLLMITPLFHIAGNTWLRIFLYMGASCVIQKSFNPENTLKTTQDEKITHISCVPTQTIAMLNLPDRDDYDINSLKYMWYGASPMPLEVVKKTIKVWGKVVAEGYGQSESGPAISHLSREEHDVLDKSEAEQKRLMSAGQPDIGVHVRIVDEEDNDVKLEELGEIVVQSKHTMVGYWKKPEDTKATLANGWLHTGDIGYFDQQGYIYIVDRKKDMIISGGENVFPREIEEVLYRHPSVLEATVIGIPDPYWVEKVHAVIVLKKGFQTTPDELKDFCKKNLAGYKIPKSIEIVEALPKNPAGKILKRELRDKYWKK